MKLNSKELESLARAIMSELDDDMIQDLFNLAETSCDVHLKDLKAAQSDDDGESESGEIDDDELAKVIKGEKVDKKKSIKETQRRTPSKRSSRR